MKNEYAEAAGRLFDDAPKQVWAALAVSLASCGGDYLEDVQARLLTEWWTLFHQGIVSQRPPSRGEGGK